LFESEPRLAQVQALSQALRAGLEPCRTYEWVKDVRVLGAIGVVELHGIAEKEALKRRLVEAGVWVRPFGNIVYLTPAFTIGEEDLARLMSAVVRVVAAGRP
jgi:adenosylmethionine-8-amino-7-oxononanoate aminotransferase